MATAWNYDDSIGKAYCGFCGFTFEYKNKWPGPQHHECNPTLYPPIVENGKHYIDYHKMQAKAKDVEASLGSQVFSFGKSVIGQMTSGLKTCTPEQINTRMQICRACPFYIPDDETKETGRCAKCGCTLNMQQSIFMNKLSQPGMSCPDNPPRWGPVAVESKNDTVE